MCWQEQMCIKIPTTFSECGSRRQKTELLLHTNMLAAPQITSTVLIAFDTVTVNLLFKQEIFFSESLK